MFHEPLPALEKNKPVAVKARGTSSQRSWHRCAAWSEDKASCQQLPPVVNPEQAVERVVGLPEIELGRLIRRSHTPRGVLRGELRNERFVSRRPKPRPPAESVDRGSEERRAFSVKSTEGHPLFGIFQFCGILPSHGPFQKHRNKTQAGAPAL